MSRKRYTLTDEQKSELQMAYDGCRDGASKIRYQVVLLYAQGRAVDEIQAITGCSRTSLLEWWRSYRQEGTPGLVDKRVGGNAAKLSAIQLEHLQVQLHQYTPVELLGEVDCRGDLQFWTVADLATVVECTYGVRYKSPTSYRSLLKSCGLSLQRPAKQYKSRSEVKVMDFEERLEKN